MRKLLLIGLFIASVFNAAQADTQAQIDQILAQESAPFGVVFEIVEGDGDALQWALPAVNQYVAQLRKRFPDIGLAVVSHGNEQFGLMTSKQQENDEVHKTVQSLLSDDVPVHVCGTHASWKGKTEQDFPDYVDVAAAGPAEIRNYESMGYVLVEVEKP